MGHTLLKAQSSPEGGLFGPQPKSYLVAPDPVPTGDRYVDRGTVCDPKDPVHEEVWRHQLDEYCFMAPGQRARQIIKFKGRVAAASDAYGRALDQARVDKLLEKSPAGAWVFELFLDVIGLAIVPAITKAFQGASPAAIAATTGIDAMEASAALRRTSEKRIETLVRQAVLSAKRSVARPPDLSSEGKKADLAYLALLTKKAEVAFQQLSESVLADSTDPDLIMLTEGYDVSNGHSVEDYKGHIDGLLGHFDNSGVGTIGTRWNEKHGRELGEAWKTETKACWVELPAGKRLALYGRTHTDGLEAGGWDPHVTHIVSTDESKRLKQRDLASHPLTFERYVPDDLVGVAVDMHIQVWGAPPDIHAAGGPEWAALAGGTR